MNGWQLHTHITLTCSRCGYSKREDTEITREGDFHYPDIPADWRTMKVADPATQKTWSYQLCATCSFDLSEFIKDGATTPPEGGV